MDRRFVCRSGSKYNSSGVAVTTADAGATCGSLGLRDGAVVGLSEEVDDEGCAGVGGIMVRTAPGGVPPTAPPPRWWGARALDEDGGGVASVPALPI
jgi:hypothetical protein